MTNSNKTLVASCVVLCVVSCVWFRFSKSSSSSAADEAAATVSGASKNRGQILFDDYEGSEFEYSASEAGDSSSVRSQRRPVAAAYATTSNQKYIKIFFIFYFSKQKLTKLIKKQKEK